MSPLPDGALFPGHYLLDDGSEPALFDVIEADVGSSRPEPHQPENVLVGRGRWHLVRRLDPGEAARLLTPALVASPLLFGTASDRVSYTEFSAHPAVSSLALVRPHSIRWSIRRSYSGRRQTRCSFALSNQFYDLACTDPLFEERLRDLDVGDYPKNVAGINARSRVLLTASLGEPFAEDGNCYKLVAAVIVLPPE